MTGIGAFDMSDIKVSFTWPPVIPPSQMFGSSLESDLTRLIDRARNEIIIMAYNIGTSSNFFLQTVISDKLRRSPNIKLKVYCDTLSDAANFRSLYYDWRGNVEIKHWVADSDSFSKFHIKCIIVDQHHIYLGSANLSYTAMNHSAECGLFFADSKIYESINKYVNVLQLNGKLTSYE